MKSMLVALVIGASSGPAVTPKAEDYLAEKCNRGCYVVPSEEYDEAQMMAKQMELEIRRLRELIIKERKWCQPERI